MRWPFGPPHLTLNPPKKTKTQKKQKNKKQEKKKPPKNQQKYQKIAFQLSVKFFHFSWSLFKFSLFWHLAPKSAHPKNTIKIGVSGPFFEKQMCVTKRPFLDQKNQNSWISVHFFAYFFSFNNTKPPNCWNPYFYSVLANLKKENFQKNNLKHWKLKKPIFAPLFWKKAIFRKLKNNWTPKKTQNDSWAPKIAWNPYFYSAKMTWPS